MWCFNGCCCDRAGVHLLPRAPCPRHSWLVLVSCPHASVITFHFKLWCFWNILKEKCDSHCLTTLVVPVLPVIINKMRSMTAEDDTSIPTEVKVPILQEFYRHIYNRDWHYSCTESLLGICGSSSLKMGLCHFFSRRGADSCVWLALQVEQITTKC